MTLECELYYTSHFQGQYGEPIVVEYRFDRRKTEVDGDNADEEEEEETSGDNEIEAAELG